MNCQEFWNTIPELGECDESHLLECPACAVRMIRHRELEAGFRALPPVPGRWERRPE